MAIITISRGSYSKGKEIAEGVAQRLDYDCISRDLLLEASEHFNIPEIKLVRALHDAPSVLERFGYGKERYMAYIQEAFLEHAVKDNMVYHGLAGQFMLSGVDHVLKVRILADLEDRIKLEMERENIPREKAQKILKKDDDERRKWAMTLWGKDCWDPSLYDLVIHIHRIRVEDAVDVICNTVSLPHFKTTPESRKKVEDLLLAAQVKTMIIGEMPGCRVSASQGSVYVDLHADLTHEAQLAADVRKLTQGAVGVKELNIHISPAGV
jgi:cytidylate kinase